VVPCAVSWFSETLRNEERTVVAGALFALSLLACDSALCSGPTMLVIFVPLVLWSLRKPAEAGLPRVYFRMLGVGFAVFIFLTLLFEVGGTNDILAEILRQFKLTLFAFVLLPLLLVALGGKRFLASALPVFTSLALVIQTLGFLAATTYSYPPSKRRKNELVEKLRGELPRFTKGSSPLTIYWPGMLDEIWFHLEQLSYFNSFQCAGVVFKRETALEAARRAQLVAPFERYYYAESRQLRYGGSFNAIPRMALGMFPDTGERGEPAFADLKKLCLDPVLDLVLLDYLPFGQRGDFIRLDDRLYLFACQNFRDSPDGDKTNSQL
jgi:hypothetical protein